MQQCRLNSLHAERAGRTLQDNNTLVFHVRDGKVTEVWEYWSDQYAADELFARNRQILWIAGEGMITRRPC
jgi:hypothetical protein